MTTLPRQEDNKTKTETKLVVQLPSPVMMAILGGSMAALFVVWAARGYGKLPVPPLISKSKEMVQLAGEELIFRHFTGTLVVNYCTASVGTILSAVIYGLTHLSNAVDLPTNIFIVAGKFGQGLICQYLYWNDRSLIQSVAFRVACCTLGIC